MDGTKFTFYDCYLAQRFLSLTLDLNDTIDKVREAYRFVEQCSKSPCSENMKLSCRSAFESDSFYDSIYKVCEDIVSMADKDTINKSNNLLTMSMKGANT